MRQIVDNYREHILDGIVINDSGEVRFVDGPEVPAPSSAACCSRSTPPRSPSSGRRGRAGVFGASPSGREVSRLFGGGWKRK